MSDIKPLYADAGFEQRLVSSTGALLYWEIGDEPATETASGGAYPQRIRRPRKRIAIDAVDAIEMALSALVRQGIAVDAAGAIALVSAAGLDQRLPISAGATLATETMAEVMQRLSVSASGTIAPDMSGSATQYRWSEREKQIIAAFSAALLRKV